MEGISTFDNPSNSSNNLFTNTVVDHSLTPDSSLTLITVPASSTNLLGTLNQFTYQSGLKRPLKDEVHDNSTISGGATSAGQQTQTQAFLDDVRKRWQQQKSESGTPVKMPRHDSNSLDTDDDQNSTLDTSRDLFEDRKIKRENSPPPVAPPITTTDLDRRTRGKKSTIRSDDDYSNSDDDKKPPPSPKSEGSNYQPSSAPSSDSEDQEFADDGISEEGSGDEYKPRRPKISIKKKAPIISALSFLASNSRRRSSSGSDYEQDEEESVKNDDDSNSNSQPGKTLFKSKNSFEMLRRLRAMRAKKNDSDFDGKQLTSKFDDTESAADASTNRRSSVDENNVDRSVTERYALSRKRQVLLSDDEDEDTNSSNSKFVAKTVEDEKTSPIFEKKSTKGGSNLKKTVVYSSSDEESEGKKEESDDDGDDEEDDEGQSHQKIDEPAPFQVLVSKKPNKYEIQDLCVQYFNKATIEQISNISRFNEKLAEALIKKRPFQSFDDLLTKMDDIKVKGASKQIVISYLQVIELQNDLDRLLQACQRIADHLQSSVDDLLEGRTSTVSQPKTTINEQYSLKPYQVLGLNWLILMNRNNLNAVLADEMGLGKTIQVIAFLAYLKEENVRGPHVVVVPSSTMDNWLNEFRRWCPTLNVLTYYGSLEDRKFLRREVQSGRQKDFDVLLSTYRVITSNADDRTFFKRMNIGYAVFDEAHMLKSCNTARYKSLMKVKAKHRLLLTGTPLQNNLIELVSLLYFVMPTLFTNHTDSLKDILSLFQAKNGSLGEYEQEKIEQAKRIMKPFVLRRLKADVLSQLPEKHDHIEVCELTGRQAELYGSLVSEYTNSVMRNENDRSDAMSMFMQLRKVANHPLLVRRLYTDEKIQKMAKILKREKAYKQKDLEIVIEDLSVMNDYQLHHMSKLHRGLNSYKLKASDIEESAKFVILDRILPEIKTQGNKVLLFSQFVLVLDVMEEFLKMRKYKYLRLDGSTPVVERQIMIDKFNNTPALFAFLLSTRAGGLGINLTSANTIILHDIDYNPYNDKQAEDRCHRVGQTKEVTVMRLIAKNTVDETMLSCAQKKLQLEQQITRADQEDDEDSRDVESLLKQALKL